MLSPYTNLGSRGFVWSAKAKHVKEMICSVSLEEDFFFNPCSSVEAGRSIPPGMTLTCPVSQRQDVTALKECQRNERMTKVRKSTKY